MKLLLVVLLFVFLVACSSTETLQDQEYEAFRDLVNSEEFTGFAYLLSDWKAEEEGYINVIEDIFKDKGETLNFINMQTADDKIYDRYNEEAPSKDIYFPNDKIAYFKDGRLISEFDINSQIASSENNSELRQFIQNHQ
jgi:hypothetical protein